MTALAARPVKYRSLLSKPRSAPVRRRSNVKIPANEGLYQMARIWPKGVSQISGIRTPQSSSADWQSAVSPAGSRLGGQTCQPRCHPAETLEKSALGIILSPGAKNVLIRAIRAIRGQPDLFPRGAGVLAHRLPHRPGACLFLPRAQLVEPKSPSDGGSPEPKASQFVRLALCLRASVVSIREIDAASSRLALSGQDRLCLKSGHHGYGHADPILPHRCPGQDPPFPFVCRAFPPLVRLALPLFPKA